MIIAIDYDGTYTEEPTLWDAFIKDAASRKHTVLICTGRTKATDPIDHGFPPGVAVYYTSNAPKRAALRMQDVEVDIWIDDAPERIVSGYDVLGEDFDEEL